MHPRLVVVNAGQGDALIAHNPETGQALMIDCASAGVVEAVAYFKANRIAKLAAVMVSHLDDDHYGGVPELLRTVPADTLIYGIAKGYAKAHSTVNAFLRDMMKYQSRGVSTGYRPIDGHEFVAPGLRVEIFGPTLNEETFAQTRNNANFASTLVRLTVGELTAILPGDCPPFRWERALFDHASQMPADVFVVPHHGSAHVGQHSLTAILDVVGPKVIVLSVGSKNRYRHPRQGTLDEVSSWAHANGAQLVCTQLNELCRTGSPGVGPAGSACAGSVVVEHDGADARLSVQRSGHLAFRQGLVAPRCLATPVSLT